MKTTIYFFILLWVMPVAAQVNNVSLQASGLTCSMCSNAINKALKTLDFVDRVDADIKTYTFNISFKTGAEIDFSAIKRKVENAGFAVSAFTSSIHFDNKRITDHDPVIINQQSLLFPINTDTLVKGDVQVKIIDKGFVPDKVYKNHLQASTPPKTYHATL